MLTFAICDDNPFFASLLSQKIHQLCAYTLPERIDCHIAPTFGSGKDVLEYLETSSINVLFLDIDMPGINGFELAEQLCKSHPDIVIIFVSSYEDFVYSSFEYCPFRFLRKSHLEQELPITFQKVIEKCIADNEIISFNTTYGEQILRLKDIVYIEGDKNYFIVYTTSRKTYRCRGTISGVEQATQKYNFFRIHAAYVINEEHIENFNNDGYVIMKDGKQIDISRRRMAAFKESYMRFIRRRITKNELLV